jgi:hypothetical protein
MIDTNTYKRIRIEFKRIQTNQVRTFFGYNIQFRCLEQRKDKT